MTQSCLSVSAPIFCCKAFKINLRSRLSCYLFTYCLILTHPAYLGYIDSFISNFSTIYFLQMLLCLSGCLPPLVLSSAHFCSPVMSLLLFISQCLVNVKFSRPQLIACKYVSQLINSSASSNWRNIILYVFNHSMSL